MGKVKIEDLQYIVMEGAGARGNTYLGAVKAIEDEFKEQEKLGNLTLAETGGRLHGIMDYIDPKTTPEFNPNEPKIKGVAGSSAGAITTFALSLGLNSSEITTVLEFDYTRFISEDHPGKYRMIDEDSSLSVGEDGKKGESTNKSIGGEKDVFLYDLTKDKTEVKGDPTKAIVRSTVVNIIVKIVVDGFISNIDQVASLFRKESNQGNKWNQFWKKIFDFFKKFQLLSVFTRLIINWLINIGLYSTGSKLSGIKFNANSVASFLLDRGLFSAFRKSVV